MSRPVLENINTCKGGYILESIKSQLIIKFLCLSWQPLLPD